MRRGLLMLGIALVLVAWHPLPGYRSVVSGQAGQVQALIVAPSNSNGVRDWDNTITRMLRSDDLQVRLEREDTLLPGRTIQQLDQYSKGVPIWGSGISRQIAGPTVISVFGVLYQDPAIDVTPRLTLSEAKSIVERVGGTELGADRQPRLMLLPEGGSFKLVFVTDVATVGDRLRFFIDANGGEVVRQTSVLETQLPTTSSVGHGVGVLGDDKKISTLALNGGFVAFDTLRPPEISTYNLRSNLTRALQIQNGLPPAVSDYAATGSNNEWTDVAAVDAHVNSSFTYDYYYKRFGRHGLDNADIPILNLTHLVRRSDAGSVSLAALGTYWVNAYYAGEGMMVYGEGLPEGTYFVPTGRHYDYFSGALDIVAHELTHGVTEYTSNLIYENESGALNESFSDIMGTSVEFFFQPVGSGPLKADYLLGEYISTAAVPGALNGDRSLENPAAYGQPDHYSKRKILPLSDDHGGVHTNSGIPNHAFYLAIEGGTNRTSGIRVQGVGASNRVQIERIFYRAFAQLMPRNANFSLARAITLQAATDLYGANSPPYNAVRDAWTAVGVN